MSVSFHAFNFSSVTFFLCNSKNDIFIIFLEQSRQWYLRYIFRIDLRNDLLYDQVHSIDSFHYIVSHIKEEKICWQIVRRYEKWGHFPEHRDRESCVIVNSNVIERERGRGLFSWIIPMRLTHCDLSVALICMQQSLLFSPFMLLFTIPSCVNDSVITVYHRVIIKRKCFRHCPALKGLGVVPFSFEKSNYSFHKILLYNGIFTFWK